MLDDVKQFQAQMARDQSSFNLQSLTYPGRKLWRGRTGYRRRQGRHSEGKSSSLLQWPTWKIVENYTLARLSMVFFIIG